MKVTYVGPDADGVYLPDLDLFCPPGESIDVPDVIGEDLVRQHTWDYTDPSDAPPPPADQELELVNAETGEPVELVEGSNDVSFPADAPEADGPDKTEPKHRTKTKES